MDLIKKGNLYQNYEGRFFVRKPPKGKPSRSFINECPSCCFHRDITCMAVPKGVPDKCKLADEPKGIKFYYEEVFPVRMLLKEIGSIDKEVV